MIDLPNMLMVGSEGRNTGKTEFVCSLIRKFSCQYNIIGIKITAIDEANVPCPHGEAGCGECASFEGNYCITEEIDPEPSKDTCKMLAAGAKQVFWIRALRKHLEEGMTALLDIIGSEAVLICESTSLRRFVEPGLFFMTKRRDTKDCKPSAEEVIEYADRIISFDGNEFDVEMDKIQFSHGRWACMANATAIIVAGGESLRMGQDKSMLLIEGKPMIKHIYDQLSLHFDQILISSNNISKYDFLGLEVVPDRIADQGPLMGIASALEVSSNSMNFVIACDIPEVDMGLVRKMLRLGSDFDAVVPRIKKEKYEPLFAVYKKSVLDTINKTLDAGKRRVTEALGECKVKYIDLNGVGHITNLNTMNDYSEFVKGSNNVIS